MFIKYQALELKNKKAIERVVFKPPVTVDNKMENEACFIYAINGKSILYGPKGQANLNSNEGVILKCGNYINSWSECKDEEPYEALAVHFYPEVLNFIYNNELPIFLKSGYKVHNTGIEKIQVDEMISNYSKSLLYYFDNPSLVTDELIKLKMKELILLLVNTDNNGGVKNILQDLFNQEEYDFKQLIKANIYNDLSIENLALLSNLSLSSFKRRFKETFNDSPAHYIKTKRLEKAADLIKNTQARISDICYDVGFNDIGHFSKSFLAQYGVNPSEFKN